MGASESTQKPMQGPNDGTTTSMTEAANIQAGTKLCSFNCKEGILVYWQDRMGGIRITRFTSPNWKWETSEEVIVKDARPNTPLAAVSWKDGQEIRLYYIGKDYKLKEMIGSIDSNNYHPGDLNEKMWETHIYSNMGAGLCWNANEQPYISVFAQMNDGNIRHFGYQNGWQMGGNLYGGQALLGTDIKCLSMSTTKENDQHLRIMYQKPSGSIYEQRMDNGDWTKGKDLEFSVPARTCLLPLGWELNYMRLYYVDFKNQVCETRFENNEWTKPEPRRYEDFEIMPGTALAGCSWEEQQGKHMTIYYQAQVCTLREVNVMLHQGFNKASNSKLPT